MNKKDAIPVIIAALVALIVTALVKWLLPISPSPFQQDLNKKQEISIPDIPLAIKKEPKKRKMKKSESFVLVVIDNFKKNEKIDLKKLKWEKWPNDNVQPYFIAKDHQNTPLNNGADYSNALKMWAKSDIPAGVPLIMDMLTDVDPVKKEEAEKKKKASTKQQKEAVEKAKLEKELEEARKEGMVRKGMRAVTLAIDQRSATSLSMLKPGDFVDVLIVSPQPGEQTKTYSYSGLRILALDGLTKFDLIKKNREEAENKANNGGLNNNLVTETPKNVTLEVKESQLEEILSRAESHGVILSLRNPEDEIKEEDQKKEEKEAEENAKKEDEATAQKLQQPTFDPIVEGLLMVSKRASLGDAHINEIKKLRNDEEESRKLMSSVLMANQAGIVPSYIQKLEKAKAKEREEYDRKLLNSFMVSGLHTPPSSEQLEERATREKIEEERAKLARSIIQITSNPISPTAAQLEEKETKRKVEEERAKLARSIIQITSNPISPTAAQLEEKETKRKVEEEREKLARSIVQITNNPISPTITQLQEKAKEVTKKHEENLLANSVLHVINNTNPAPSELLKEREKRRQREEETACLVKNLIAQGSNTIFSNGAQSRPKGVRRGGGKYEVVSGKIAGEDDEDESPVATIYRKLTASTVEFDEEGRPIKKEDEAGEAEAGNAGGSAK